MAVVLQDRCRDCPERRGAREQPAPPAPGAIVCVNHAVARCRAMAHSRLVLAGALFLIELPDWIEPGTRRTELGQVAIERVLPAPELPHQVARRHPHVLHVVEEMRAVLQGPSLVIAGERRLSLVRDIDVSDDDREIFLHGVVAADLDGFLDAAQLPGGMYHLMEDDLVRLVAG